MLYRDSFKCSSSPRGKKQNYRERPPDRHGGARFDTERYSAGHTAARRIGSRSAYRSGSALGRTMGAASKVITTKDSTAGSTKLITKGSTNRTTTLQARTRWRVGVRYLGAEIAITSS